MENTSYFIPFCYRDLPISDGVDTLDGFSRLPTIPTRNLPVTFLSGLQHLGPGVEKDTSISGLRHALLTPENARSPEPVWDSGLSAIHTVLFL